jgi:hypothetical protein
MSYHASPSQIESRRRWRLENPEKVKRASKQTQLRSDYKEACSRRHSMIVSRAKKVRAKLDEIGYCEMAEILFGDQT